MEPTPSLTTPGTKPAAHPIWRHVQPWAEPLAALFVCGFLAFVLGCASVPGVM
jgi:hypothetical protein